MRYESEKTGRVYATGHFLTGPWFIHIVRNLEADHRIRFSST